MIGSQMHCDCLRLRRPLGLNVPMGVLKTPPDSAPAYGCHGKCHCASLFYFQAGPEFSAVATTPIWKLLLLMVIGFTLVPVDKALDIRGWAQMYPLNGPAWSLFFEYIPFDAFRAPRSLESTCHRRAA